MCGITGIISLSGRPIRDAQNRIRRMTSMLTHRGPDSQGVYVSDDGLMALGNTRLAIVDPLNTTEQPLKTGDGKLVLSFNGEIYNYMDIREDLQKRGVSFRTRMDTEVLLEGLRLEGEEFLQKLDGMWAFAYYDTRSRRLLISRDILGERHVFYRMDKDEFVFASEVKPLLEDSSRHFEVDFNSFLTALQYFAAPPGRTMVRDIHRMFPGHNISVEAGGGVRQYRYKKLHPEKWFDFFSRKPSLEEAIETFERIFERSCKRRLPREVPYICTLSGGLDTTLICAHASDFGRTRVRTLYGQSAEKPAQNFKHELDEYSASLFTSKKINSWHEHIYLNSDESVPILRQLSSNAFDGMFDSGVASFAMLAFHAKRQNTKVMLISDGPDEFLGYPKDLKAYRIDNIYNHNRLRYNVMKLLSSGKFSRRGLNQMGLKGLIIPPLFSYEPFRFSPIHESWGIDKLSDVLGWDEIISTVNYYGVTDPVYDELKPHMDYTQLRALSYASFSLPDMFNLRTDKAYMSASVEARLPYQAPEMVELTVAMPSFFRFNNGDTTKYLLRKIIERHIGPEISNRSKHGFSSPIWISPNVYKAMRYEEVVMASSIFNDLPFKKGVRDYIMRPENKSMIWPFYVLARTHDQLKRKVFY